MSSSSIKSNMDSLNRDILNLKKYRENEVRNVERYQREVNNYQKKVNDYDRQILDKEKRLSQLQKDYERELAREKK